MKLNLSQTRAFSRVTDLFALLGKEQRDLATNIGGGVTEADLSRAKGGYVPQRKWHLILEKLEALAHSETCPEHSKWVEEIRMLISKSMRNGKLSGAIDDADFAGFPDLQHAALARRYNQELNQAIWGGSAPSVIETVPMTYPEKPNKPNPEFLKRLLGPKWEDEFKVLDRLHGAMKRFQASLRTAIVEANGSRGECKIEPAPATMEVRGLLSPARIQTTALIYLVPFFLTADRRFDYGVVRYGAHKSIGLVLSKATLKGSLHCEPDAIEPGEFAQLLATDLMLHHVEPYSAEHILSQMLLQYEDESVLARFNKANMPPESGFEAAVERLTDDPGRSVLVFELADQFVMAEELLKHQDEFPDHKVVRLNHRVETDVGIGFSLRAFEWIVNEDRFKTLRQRAFSFINEELRHDLRHIGIEMDAGQN